LRVVSRNTIRLSLRGMPRSEPAGLNLKQCNSSPAQDDVNLCHKKFQQGNSYDIAVK
jgi:hypothetical protein